MDDLFASRTPRLIGSAQLVNSLRTASGLLLDFDDIQQSTFAKQFVVDNPSESFRSTVQSLMMMNGDLVTKACDPQSSPLILTLLDAPFLDDANKVESLFLRTLSRYPSTEERKLAFEFLQSQRKHKVDDAQTFANLLWTLLNTAEFHTIE